MRRQGVTYKIKPMSFLDSVLKVFVGDKSKQDVNAINPIVNKIKTFEAALEALPPLISSFEEQISHQGK